MGELLGITGAIGSGKTTFARCLTDVEPSHAHYETWLVIADIANAFNRALKAELAYETTNQPLELANQVLIWLPEAISEHLHHDVVWNQLAVAKRDTASHPDQYDKLFDYLTQVRTSPKLLNAQLSIQNKEDYRALLQWLGNYLIVKLSKTIWYDELMRRIDLHDSDKNMVVITGVRYPSDAEVVRAHGGRVIGITRPEVTNGNTDATEAQRSAIKPDIIVTNNGDLQQLQVLAENIWRDIGAGSPKASYTAA